MRNLGFVRNQTGELEIKPVRDSLGKIIRGLIIGDVTQQNQAQIISMNAGELKECPTLGIGITSLLLSHETLLAKHRIREQLEFDRQRVSYLDVKIVDNSIDININANYK